MRINLLCNLVVVSAAVLVLSGCASARRAAPLAPELAGSGEDAQVAFWLAVTDRPVVSCDEAFHGLLLFVDGEDEAVDYAGRVNVLRARRMLPAGFDRPSDAPVRRGDLAVAIARVLEVRGGLFMRLTGGTLPRYALRELTYRGILPPSSENQTVTGIEFAGIIGKVEDVQRAAAERASGATP